MQTRQALNSEYSRVARIWIRAPGITRYSCLPSSTQGPPSVGAEVHSTPREREKRKCFEHVFSSVRGRDVHPRTPPDSEGGEFSDDVKAL